MTSNVDAIAQLFAPLATGGLNQPPLPEIFPDYSAPVIVAGDGPGDSRRLQPMRWGWPPFGQIKRPISNIRNLASPMWHGAIADPRRRCLVPVTAFCEWCDRPDPATGRKRKHWFALSDHPLFAFAGLWRPSPDGPRFAFLTCEANALVGAVHEKAMPVIVTPGAAAHQWLSGAAEDACARQCAFPAERMVEVEVDEPASQPSLL